eukprot:CAMPEP_0197590348 /NCGR_PEP_ID=MMETSP1326-20131121/10969_1 /TAXON_ID=1155430 /ORGANISM="Genus nov. species nov., Strain RCC2288" /LENGTH=32 /DNA_ID= /DNA_START= /DNA_END= /DNA_ORIENTATION=
MPLPINECAMVNTRRAAPCAAEERSFLQDHMT